MAVFLISLSPRNSAIPEKDQHSHKDLTQTILKRFLYFTFRDKPPRYRILGLKFYARDSNRQIGKLNLQ